MVTDDDFNLSAVKLLKEKGCSVYLNPDGAYIIVPKEGEIEEILTIITLYGWGFRSHILTALFSLVLLFSVTLISVYSSFFSQLTLLYLSILILFSIAIVNMLYMIFNKKLEKTLIINENNEEVKINKLKLFFNTIVSD